MVCTLGCVVSEPGKGKARPDPTAARANAAIPTKEERNDEGWGGGGTRQRRARPVQIQQRQQCCSGALKVIREESSEEATPKVTALPYALTPDPLFLLQACPPAYTDHVSPNPRSAFKATRISSANQERELRKEIDHSFVARR